MIKNLFISLAVIFISAPALAASDNLKLPKNIDWPFEGATGSFDKAAVQRGYQVYKEVCSSCHSMKLISFRNLQQIGFTAEEVKKIASEYSVIDGPDSSGDMFDRPARPSDRFVSPFANENAARASNGGALPPDLSLITKARVGGSNYVYSLLTGYNIVPSDVVLDDGMNYNLYFPSRQIAMAPPLSEGIVDYMDGTEATVEQMSYDVVNFLQWAAEPEMEDRKRMGIKTLIFISIFTILFILAKRTVWARLEDEE